MFGEQTFAQLWTGFTLHAALLNKSVVCSGSRVTNSTAMKLHGSDNRGGIIVKTYERALAHIIILKDSNTKCIYAFPKIIYNYILSHVIHISRRNHLSVFFIVLLALTFMFLPLVLFVQSKTNACGKVQNVNARLMPHIWYSVWVHKKCLFYWTF